MALQEIISAAPRSVLKAEKISKTLPTANGPLTLFSNLSLSLGAGQSLGIQGTSGAGKSTLLACLAGISQVSSGTIELLDQHIEGLDANARAHIRQQNIGFVFQNFQLLPHLNALENVTISLEISGFSAKISKEKAKESLEKVGLSQHHDRFPHQLSGGEQQRVAIARAICREPAIIFADEPTGNLDPKTSEHIMQLLMNCQNEQKAAVVLVTHDAEVAGYLDRCLMLSEGSLLHESR